MDFILFVAGQWHDWEHGTDTTRSQGEMWKQVERCTGKERHRAVRGQLRQNRVLNDNSSDNGETRNTRELIRKC